MLGCQLLGSFFPPVLGYHGILGGATVISCSGASNPSAAGIPKATQDSSLQSYTQISIQLMPCKGRKPA